MKFLGYLSGIDVSSGHNYLASRLHNFTISCNTIYSMLGFGNAHTCTKLYIVLHQKKIGHDVLHKGIDVANVIFHGR